MDPAQGVRIDVHARADHVAEIARPQDRKEQIGTGLESIYAQRRAEPIVMMRQAGLGRRIEQAADPDHAIDHEAAERLGRALDPELQHVVAENHRLAELGDEVVQYLADRGADAVGIAQRQRPQDRVVDHLVDRIEAPVDPLEGVFDGQGVLSGVRLDDRLLELGLGRRGDGPDDDGAEHGQRPDGAPIGAPGLHSRSPAPPAFARA